MFGLTNCKNQNKKTNSDEKLVKQEYSPLFLSLSPKMTDNEFQDEINHLNDEKKLDLGYFIIPVRDKRYKFFVYKTEKTIRLNYYEDKSLTINDFDVNIADEYIRDAETKTSEIIQIFEDKYGRPKIKFPLVASLSDYDISKYNNIYQDSSKTVLVGYNIFGTRDPTPNPEELFVDSANNINTYEKDIPYGFSITIDYYYNEDFEKLLKKIHLDTEINEQKRQMKFKEDAEKRKKDEDDLKNNLNNL